MKSDIAEEIVNAETMKSDIAEESETVAITADEELRQVLMNPELKQLHSSASITLPEEHQLKLRITHIHAEVYSLQEHNARGYIPSLSSKIDAAKRDTFIKKVFHKDPELFETFVKDIDKTYSWKEAAAAIDRFYVRHNIKDSGAVAKELRTIIQKRYAR
jgi:hypothetical protein